MFQSWGTDHDSAINYLRNITKILAEYSWIYSVRNTEIFVQDVLDKIPAEWVEAILDLPENDFKKLPFGFIKDNWPASLKSFITQCTQLAELRFPKCIIPAEKIHDSSIEKNMPLKKRDEIVAMSILVHQICKVVKCYKVLDIGSGLGYIDQFLHHKFGLQCIGLDYKEKKTESAKYRLKEDPCILAMHHETIEIENTDECIERLKVILKNAENINPVCQCRTLHFSPDSFNDTEKASFVMIGLHCCGDLTQDMMKLFCSIKELKAFVCIGCCYNKININEFPLSETVQNVLNSVCEDFPDWYPCVSGLRIGSHATRTEMKDMTSEGLLMKERNLIYRGILQCYINQDNITWKKPKRRVRDGDLASFEEYCEMMFSKSKEILSDAQRQERMAKLNDIYSSKEILFPRVRVLLILQTLLQPLWECFILFDRKFYLQEHSLVADVCAVWDDAISPRNMAVCAYKC